jgi:hypothetical protein
MKVDPAEEGSASLPIACTLTPAEMSAMRDGLLPGLLGKSTSRGPIPGGYRWRFETRSGLLKEVAAVIEAERRCCRFLCFVLIVEPGDGPVSLEITGPEGTEAFLSTLLGLSGTSL